MFKRKRKRTIFDDLDENVLSFAVHSSHDNKPMIYLYQGGSKGLWCSLLWQGKVAYENPGFARVAADFQLRKTLEALLTQHPEKDLSKDFS